MNVILLMEMIIQLIKYLFLVQWLDLDKVTLHLFHLKEFQVCFKLQINYLLGHKGFFAKCQNVSKTFIYGYFSVASQC